MLADLARHPATAKHVATKLACHFIADDPPPVLVERLTQRFLDTDGDLKEVTRALIASPEAWDPQQAKIKRPGEWIVALLRATGISGDIQRIVGGMALLGEPLWRPPAPKGFSDDNAAWLDGLAQRLDIANTFAQRVGDRLDAKALADTALGPLASAETRRAIATRREQTAGDDIPADGFRISAEVTMPADFPRSDAARTAARLRRAVRLGRGAAHRPRRGPRPAPSDDCAARRARWARGGRAGRRSRLDQAAQRKIADRRRPDPGFAARRLLRAEPGDAEFPPPVPGGSGDDRARGRDTLSRALAFRRSGRARKRAREAGSGRYRLAQPRALGAWSPAGVSIRMPGRPLRSARSRRSSCAGRRRCSRGFRLGCRRSATTRRCASSTSTAIPIRPSRACSRSASGSRRSRRSAA